MKQIMYKILYKIMKLMLIKQFFTPLNGYLEYLTINRFDSINRLAINKL